MINETIDGLSPNEEDVLLNSLERLNLYFKDKYKLIN
jgi:hypothetical protein